MSKTPPAKHALPFYHHNAGNWCTYSEKCAERLSLHIDLDSLFAGLAAHSRKKPTPKKRPSAMGMSDAECAARNRNVFAFKLWARRVGYSATKASFLNRTNMSLLCCTTPSHLYMRQTTVCSPVRTLGVLPTYKHTKRTHKEAGYQLYPTPRLLSVRTPFPIQRWQLVRALRKTVRSG